MSLSQSLDLSSAREMIDREFDRSFYLGQLDEAVDDPVLHYLESGWAKGLDPSPDFHSRFYLRAYPDVAAAGLNPFLHYLTEGRDQGRSPSASAMNMQVLGMKGAFDLLTPHVDHFFYLGQCPSLKAANINPVHHYLTYGWKLGFDPSPGFSNAFYLARSPDIVRAGMNPLHHYLGWGRREGRLPHPDCLSWEKTEAGEVEEVVAPAFDRDFYLLSHPELVDNHVDPVKHYLAFGAGQGFDPTSDFSTEWYLSRSPDVAASGMNPFYHYLIWGKVEGRSPRPGAPAFLFGPASSSELLVRSAFDPDFYRAQNVDVVANHVDPLKHYLHYGWRRGSDPSEAFSTRFYLRQDPSLVDGPESPLHHYLRLGWVRGRLPRSPLVAFDAPQAMPELTFLESEFVAEVIGPEFDVGFYADAYPTVAEAGLDPVWDYILMGWREGRDPVPWFSTRAYIERYPDVVDCRYNPFFHYLVWGREQGFAPGGGPATGSSALRSASSRTVHALDLRELSSQGARASPSVRAAAPTQPASLDPGRLNLHWVIPDIEAPGRGGLMTVMRMVHRLELMGHTCNLWVLDPDYARSDRERLDTLLRDYQVVNAAVRLLGDTTVFPADAVVIATSWPTAHRVRTAAGGAMKAYFVQDDEAEFYPAGSRALAADLTYDLDLAYICAGPWLERKLIQRGRWVRAFPLAADERYGNAELSATKPSDTPRIAFYARDTTPRRAVELGLLAFEILAARGERFHVDLFGADVDLAEAPFSATSHGMLDVEALRTLYRQCDLGLCFSATNYSLIPQEMMACGLAAVELDVESTRAVFPADAIALAGPAPEAVADVVADLLHDAPVRARQAERAQAWVSQSSWSTSARLVEAALLERAGHLGIALTPTTLASVSSVDDSPKVSVIIPTYDGGPLFQRVLARVLQQQAPFAFEVVVVDSGSSDGTWEHLETQGRQVRRIQIDKADFQHGRTRNFAAGLAKGEHLVFLTQDALPVGLSWLYNLVTTLQRYPLAAGAFGRHRARAEASPFVRRGVEDHFATLGAGRLEVSKYDDLSRWRARDETFRRSLHYFSNNNACIRRSVWVRHPFPEIDFGEDQAWAARIIDEGYSKVYAPLAEVTHSHSYDEAETFDRARTDAYFQIAIFNYAVAPDDPDRRLRQMNAGDLAWGLQRGIPSSEIEDKQRLNASEIAGIVAGAADAAQAKCRHDAV